MSPTKSEAESTNLRVMRRSFLTRVEGEGGLYVRVEGRVVKDVQLTIFEPPRFFEAMLRGRSFQEVPDIVARICGICPVAYQMSSVHALERALGVTVAPEIRRLRRLLYCGEWIESHALHIYLLHAPDFLGYPSVIEMAGDLPKEVERGLRLKKIGNRLLEVLGGRATHPVSVSVGGFYKAPRAPELRKLADDLKWGLEASRETLDWVMALRLPDFTPDYEFVALSHPDEYAMNEGDVASSAGLRVVVENFKDMFLEKQVEHSTALHSVRADRDTSYFVGPLARLNLSREKLMPQAREAAKKCGISWPARNPFAGMAARAIEMMHAFEEALAIVSDYREPEQSRATVEPRAGEGCAATEAPRGLLYHQYRLDASGNVEFARIVPPTSQNLRRMEDDIRLLLPPILDQSEAEILAACENLVRAYDPCLSCSTHFLRLKLERQ